MDFKDKDWNILSELASAEGGVNISYLNLVLDYITANADRVRGVMNLHDSYSDFLLGDEIEKITGILGTIDKLDEQSVFVMKLQGRIKSSGGDRKYVDYLRESENSTWMKQRMLYPMVYFAVNTPSEDYIDTFLSYMLPQDDTGGVERGAVRHILRDDLSFSRSLSYWCYIALMMHPFDALESIVNWLEINLCKNSDLTEIEKNVLNCLSKIFPGSRADRLRRQLTEWLSHDGSDWPEILRSHSLPSKLTTVLNAFVDCSAARPPDDALPTEEWKAICRMRWSRYPEPKDFDLVEAFSRSWTFTEAGRLFAALMVSMYMVPRQPELQERRHLLRLHRFCAKTTPYLWAVPRGQWLMRKQINRQGGWLGGDLRAGVELNKQANSNSRTWFHSVHWKLEKAERMGRVRDWLSLVRENFPIKPAYLTGIDWGWVDRVLPVSRIAPFRENANGAYALLLRDIQEQQRDTTLLRTSIEPLRQSNSCADFIDKLIIHYSSSAVAFVRFFLTPENIMLLGLAPNMTAALSERIYALERCATEYHFSELLTEDQLRQEQQVLTSALMLLNVNANQFDIPWGSFRRDAANRQRDMFDAHLALSDGDKTKEIINDHDILYAHRFANGASHSYSLSGAHSALTIIVLGIIDTFMDHPSYGIEAILSTRFRHDTMRREFVFSFSELGRSYISGVVPEEQRELIEDLSSRALDELDAWLFQRMQSLRPGFDRAIFDFVPKDSDLETILSDINSKQKIDDIIDVVITWISAKLESQLEDARAEFSDGFAQAAIAAVAKRVAELYVDSVSDPQVINRVGSAVSDTITRRAMSLLEWFRMPSQGGQASLTFAQIAAAVEGRFEQLIIDGRLRISSPSEGGFEQELAPERVRFYFDLLSEVVQNAVKYSGRDKAYVRLGTWKRTAGWGVTISSTAAPGATRETVIAGHPYLSLSDALFREGNSGLEKIGALSASIVGDGVEVVARRGRRGFHLDVPLRADSGCGLNL